MSATGSKEAGFTLVELMMVIVIIGLMSAAAVLAIPDPGGRVSDEAESFAARLVAARDLAITGGSDIGVRIDGAGYGFEVRGGAGWVPVGEKALGPRRWAEGVAATPAIEGGGALVFDATGLATPGVVELARDGAAARVAIDAGGAVRIDGR